MAELRKKGKYQEWLEPDKRNKKQWNYRCNNSDLRNEIEKNKVTNKIIKRKQVK